MLGAFVRQSTKLVMLATLIVAFGAGVLVGSPGAVAPVGAQDQYAMGNADIAAVYEAVAQSVVNINVVQHVEGFSFGVPSVPSPDNPDEQQPPEGFQFPFPNQGDEYIRQGQGSGFVYDTDGHIITNYHVVQGADKIVVSFYDGTLARAEVVAEDPESDIAVLKVEVDPEVLQPVTFADSEALYVGQPVIAIGSPYGQEWTLTTGVVSALGRTISSGFSSFSISSGIQTDAAINPVNSGGPLMNINGEVIGVNAQIISQARANAGVGFAIPGNLVQRVAQALIDEGSYHYAWLGISGRTIDLDLIEALDLEANQRGVLVDTVTSGGPADRAGLHGNDAVVTVDGQDLRVGGDIIIAVNDEPIRFMDELIAYLVEETQPGDEITLTVLRDGQEVQVAVTLGDREDFSARAQTQ
ncbi:MAG: hypothetical protein Kow00120_20670 [Anaerolineae bacterium]